LKTSKFKNANPIDKLNPKEHAVVSMCFADGTENEVLVAQKNGQISVFSAVHETYTSLFDAAYDGRSELKAIQMSEK
jgi:hypothetical protein